MTVLLTKVLVAAVNLAFVIEAKAPPVIPRTEVIIVLLEAPSVRAQIEILELPTVLRVLIISA